MLHLSFLYSSVKFCLQRPLLPIHVKVIDNREKKLKLDTKSFSGETGSCSNSMDGGSSISSPATDYSNAPTPPLSIVNSPSSTSLPSLFSKLQMVTIVPPKPRTAAQFTLSWKQIKSNPDVSAQFLNVIHPFRLVLEEKDR